MSYEQKKQTLITMISFLKKQENYEEQMVNKHIYDYEEYNNIVKPENINAANINKTADSLIYLVACYFAELFYKKEFQDVYGWGKENMSWGTYRALNG